MKNDNSIIEGNKLIAEFMGYKLVDKPDKLLGKWWRPQDFNMTPFYPLSIIENPDNLLFNTSWDWLMPVVEKVENMGYVSIINGMWNKNYTYSFSIVNKSNSSIQYGRGISDNKKIDCNCNDCKFMKRDLSRPPQKGKPFPINYGYCELYKKSVTFIPGTCQIETQNCFIHRKN